MTKRIICLCLAILAGLSVTATNYRLHNDRITVEFDASGRLVKLQNSVTGTDYAGGDGIWRLYFDTHEQKEVQVSGEKNKPVIKQARDSIIIKYKGLKPDNRIEPKQKFNLTLTVSLEADMVRFASRIENNEPHTIIRELQYPLVGDLNLPKDHRVLTTKAGGHFYDNIKELIATEGLGGLSKAYMTPAQYYRQLEMEYPYKYVGANCFAVLSDKEGLYFGSHDETFQNTVHGLRVYPSKPEVFDRLECGFYKYPNCLSGKTWECKANVLAPYCGDWTQTSRFYRRWVDATWWDRLEPPMWVKKMTGWQRVIFKHQYGEYFFKYKDLYGRMLDVEKKVGSDAVLIFGWWKAGMDNSNPDYVPDPSQGGERGLKEAIKRYRDAGGHPLLYVNGKIIDRESEFYRSGKAKGLIFHDNSGAECVENYKFTSHGSFLGSYNFRSFVVADTRNPVWRGYMKGWADMAYEYGASSIFYDQMGSVDKAPAFNWDLSGEFPIPDVCPLTAKRGALKECRDYIRSKYPDFAIGAEHITDCLSMYLDYNHGDGYLDFIEWFRYTFPELIVSDRRIRDDNDIERRVNWTILKGVRNDIEIYRCRDLIDKTPHYMEYLTKVNGLKKKYEGLLLLGKFCYMDHFSIDNPKVEARCFTNGDRMAIVATQELKKAQTLKARLDVPGWHYVEHSTLGKALVEGKGLELTLGQYDLAVIIFEKD